MRQNNSILDTSDYYIGLDVGTSSVGWAVTDPDYHIEKFGKKSMWGIRLFEEGNTAEERRTSRINRRRLARRHWRIQLLKEIFDPAVSAVDPGFYRRMEESSLIEKEDAHTKNALFADADFTDKDFHTQYPTIYHLRKQLMERTEPCDVRLVYLAIHHILKARGHFLSDVDTEDTSDVNTQFQEFCRTLSEMLCVQIQISCEIPSFFDQFKKARTAKERKKLYSVSSEEGRDEKEAVGFIECIFKLISGSTLLAKKLWPDTSSTKKLDLRMSEEELTSELELPTDEIGILLSAKRIRDSFFIQKIVSNASGISDYKVKQYEQHKNDIRTLKDYVRNVMMDNTLYRKIFYPDTPKSKNYAAYINKGKESEQSRCLQEEFCAFLKSVLKQPEASAEPRFLEMYRRIEENEFAPVQRSSENGAFPNSMHKKELERIVANASQYLPFLNEIGPDGTTAAEKILALVSFHIPYYVGPVGSEKYGWAVRNPGEEHTPLTPWNFDAVINKERSAEGFIRKMTSLCTYTGKDVLPKASLLYSKFLVLNELNNLTVDGNHISAACKKKIYEGLFVKSNRKVTGKRIVDFLYKEGEIPNKDVHIGGVKDPLMSSLGSYHKMRRIIDATSEEVAEDVILWVTLFGNDKKLLRKLLEERTPLSSDEIKYSLGLRFEGWGSLSREFLEDVRDDEGRNIITMLMETNENLMRLMSNTYRFAERAAELRRQTVTQPDSMRSAVDGLYVSPKIRRSIWQTLRILNEITGIKKSAPKKIFIEVAREQTSGKKGKETESRKKQLISLYKSCKMEAEEIYKQLDSEEDARLRSDKLYLYYTQFGRCMYSGEPINLQELTNQNCYDIDHIFPRSKIKDDSLDNRVLVRASLNREKTDRYPIDNSIREKMYGYWAMLHKAGLISDKKFERLTRATPLTSDELSSFVSRQLVETRQSTKALAELLKEYYPNTKIVYSKAGNVSEFRQFYKFVKFRGLNDHHHAKDAYLNVVVGNFYDTKFSAEFFKTIQTQKYSLRPEALYDRDVPGAWVKGTAGTIETVRQTMSRNDILFTRMPVEVRGALFDVQPMKAGKGQVPRKQGLDIAQYGGYNKPTGTYFSLIESVEKGKKVRSLEAVYLYQKAEYESDPDEFAKSHWNATAKVIIPKIHMKSLLELTKENAKGYIRANIAGRTGNNLVFHHAHQLVADEKTIRQLKVVEKFIARYDEKRGLLLDDRDGISSENNLRLYDFFLSKLNSGPYSVLLNSLKVRLHEGRDVFQQVDIPEQCSILLQILKSFRCNAENSDLSKLCGKSQIVPARPTKKFSGYEKVYLVHQSVTGLYEYKTDLLH